MWYYTVINCSNHNCFSNFNQRKKTFMLNSTTVRVQIHSKDCEENLIRNPDESTEQQNSIPFRLVLSLYTSHDPRMITFLIGIIHSSLFDFDRILPIDNLQSETLIKTQTLSTIVVAVLFCFFAHANFILSIRSKSALTLAQHWTDIFAVLITGLALFIILFCFFFCARACTIVWISDIQQYGKHTHRDT